MDQWTVATLFRGVDGPNLQENNMEKFAWVGHLLSV